MSASKKSGLRFTLKKLFKRSKHSGSKHSGSKHSGSKGSRHSGSKRSGSRRSGSKSNKDTSCIETKGTIGGLAHKRWDLLFGDIKNCSAENLQKIAERKAIWADQIVELRKKKDAEKKLPHYGGARRTKKHKHKRK